MNAGADMKAGAIAGLALLVALIVYSLTREGTRRTMRQLEGGGTVSAGDGERAAARTALPPRHVHEGDPSVRH